MCRIWNTPTDLFDNYSLRKVAKKFNIKYVLAGTNPQTESVMGSNWSYGQRDPIYLKKLYELTWKKSPSKLPFKIGISQFLLNYLENLKLLDL